MLYKVFLIDHQGALIRKTPIIVLLKIITFGVAEWFQADTAVQGADNVALTGQVVLLQCPIQILWQTAEIDEFINEP